MKWITSLRNLIRKSTPEIAPQLSHAQRRQSEFSGTASGRLTYQTYDLMQQDAMIQTALTIKRHGTLATPFQVVPFDDSSQAKTIAAFVNDAFNRMEGSAQTILFHAMDAFAKGWSVQETIYEECKGKIWIKAVRPKDPSIFGAEVDAYGTVTGLTLNLPGESMRSLPRGKFVVFANRPLYGRPKGTSDLDPAYPHYAAKQRLMQAWRVHLERYASPTVLGKYERGLPPDEQSSMLDALKRLHETTSIVYPSEIDISLLDASRQSIAGFLDAIDFHNREIARAILGQTLTTDEGRRVGSLSLGKVHLQVLMLQLNSLRRLLADEILTEQIVRPLVALNFGDVPMPRVEFESATIDAFATGRVS